MSRFGVGLIIWLLCVEAGVEVWYRIRESHIKPGLDWSLTFPTDNPTTKMLPIDSKTSNLLRFDEAEEGVWNESDGSQWQAFYCNWRPGRVAGYLAKRHTPEICLPATGLRMVAGAQLRVFSIKGVSLPVRSYVFEVNGRPLNVFHCRWEAGVDVGSYVEHESARYNLVRSIWTGRGNRGEKVLELMVSGFSDPRQAEAALVNELDKLIVIHGAHKGLDNAMSRRRNG